jgi:peptidoglycan/xylan/chitin deacetylase (PgdA/CDA1 family)
MSKETHTCNRQPIPILTYHQIADAPPKGAPFRSLYVPAERFRQQLRMLKTFGYQGLSMRDLMPYLRGEKQGKVVGITLDDGYLNNHDQAMPALLEQGFTATCYVVSQLLGQSNVWDHGIGIAPAPLMDRRQIRTWSDAGLEIGAHTRHHVNLTEGNDTDMATEIKHCRLDLEDTLGKPVDQFCYPFGIYEQRHVSMAAQAGYLAATTTHRGQVLSGADLFQLRRIPVVRSTYWPQFLLKVLTAYENKHIPHGTAA